MKTKSMEELEGKPEHKEEKKSEREGGKKGKSGLHLREMHVRFLHDHSAVVKHLHEDKHGMIHHHQPEYSASSLEDLHDHMDQHAAPAMAGGDAGGEGEDPADGEAAPPAPQQAQSQAAPQEAEGE